MSWDPSLYLRFDTERTQPCIDLVARINLENPLNIVDLGCGPGNSTAVLARRWPQARITGVDSSEEMLAQARREQPGGRFELGDVAAWAPESAVDLVFSNALMQWVKDHDQQLPRQLSWVHPGGLLAMQIPYHLESEAHKVIRETVSRERWAAKIGDPGASFDIRPPEQYYEILAGRVQRVDIWITHYIHVLDSVDAVIEWVRGTGLRPVLAKLEPSEQTEFLGELRQTAAGVFRPQSDGRVLFHFPRLFLLAQA